MIYNEHENLIEISVREFVSISRRLISPILPLDEDEPELVKAKDSLRLKLMGSKEGVPMSFSFTSGETNFKLIGEADGLDGDSITLIVETDSPVDRIKKEEQIQARGELFILAKLLKSSDSFDAINGNIIYTDRMASTVKTASERISAKAIDTFFDKCLREVVKYAEPEIDRVSARLPSLKNLKFPFANARDGQIEFIKSVYRSISAGKTLIAGAPTGTGKTVSTIYPALRSLGDGYVKKVFYLTPKALTAAAAEDCIKLICDSGARIKAISITAKEKICPIRMVCRDSKNLCSLTKFNLLSDAVMELYHTDIPVITEKTVREVAEKYRICPYELELSYAEICDFVICDINYLFDPIVYIRRFFTEGGKYAFLIDEAHNLPDRAREMYSCEITEAEISEIYSCDLISDLSPLKKYASVAHANLRELLMSYLKDDIRYTKEGARTAGTHLSEAPWELYGIFSGLEKEIEDELKRVLQSKAETKSASMKFLRSHLYKIKKFNLCLNIFDSSYRTFIHLENETLRIKLFCVDTKNVLRERLKKGHGAVFFSATLEPTDYYKSLLGADNDSPVISVRSPFDPEQLCVSIMDNISTRYSERERTLPAVCRVIAAAMSSRRGNYMVFSPSFEYSEALYESFKRLYPKIETHYQSANMSAEQKNALLDRFKTKNSGYLLGFCVMGGIYSEGIDLVGDSLIGAIVVGIGMPSLSYEREAMAEYFQDKYEKGKEYAYIYPGMNKVFQAAGRVIRSEDDVGQVVLIDDRFRDPIYKKNIPALWKGMRYIADAKELKERLDLFWKDKQDK